MQFAQPEAFSPFVTTGRASAEVSLLTMALQDLSGRWVSLSYTGLTQGSNEPKEPFTFPKKSNGHPLQFGKHW